MRADDAPPSHAADTATGSTFSIHLEPPLPSASRRRQPSSESPASRRRKRFVRKWWRAFAAAALGLWIAVSVLAAIDAVGTEYLVRPRDIGVTERATCYSANRAEYEECVVTRAAGRSSGREPLKPPMLTPFRLSLCATMQDRFSREEFWDCVKALSDPLR